MSHNRLHESRCLRNDVNKICAARGYRGISNKLKKNLFRDYNYIIAESTFPHYGRVHVRRVVLTFTSDIAENIVGGDNSGKLTFSLEYFRTIFLYSEDSVA